MQERKNSLIDFYFVMTFYVGGLKLKRGREWGSWERGNREGRDGEWGNRGKRGETTH